MLICEHFQISDVDDVLNWPAHKLDVWLAFFQLKTGTFDEFHKTRTDRLNEQCEAFDRAF